jgi:photosystem II stability/assembly factor-like uncharacterized protein
MFYTSFTPFYNYLASTRLATYIFIPLFQSIIKIMSINQFAFLLFVQCFAACNYVVEFPAGKLAIGEQQKCVPAESANIVLQSADGGQTWQDISRGLPENIQVDNFLVKDGALYLRSGSSIFQSKAGCSNSSWEKEALLNGYRTIAAGSGRLLACDKNGQFMQKNSGTDAWLPVTADFREKSVHTIFETPNGTIFIGCDEGIFKSANSGKTWQQVDNKGWVRKIAELNGVLIATCDRGILRSTDDGEHWELVVSEGGVGIAAERINGGFAVITYNAESKTRRIRTSADGGKTWQPIDEGLRPQATTASLFAVGKIDQTINAGMLPEASITSIIQFKNYFYCGHPTGIFRSEDNGKTWKLILASKGNKVFTLYVADNMIYAIPINGGC